MSLTNKKVYTLKKQYLGKGVTKTNDYLLTFGQNQIQFYDNFIFKVLIGSTYRYFETNNDKAIDIFGKFK